MISSNANKHLSPCLVVLAIAAYCPSAVSAQSLSHRYDAPSKNSKTQGNFNGASSLTNYQNYIYGNQTSSSAPLKGTYNAPGNLALRQLGRNSLPPTRLTGFVKDGGNAVFGDEGELLPPFLKFEPKHRIERAIEKRSPDLTTNHRISTPSAWDFPE